MDTIKQLFLCIAILVLSGCTLVSGDSAQNTSVPITRTPTTEAIATLELTGPYPVFNLDEVFCRVDLNSVQDTGNWVDALKPGVSTVDDLLTLQNIPEEHQPERKGVWYGFISNIDMVFMDGILVSKIDPRKELGDIVAHYGTPEMIVWQLPSFYNDHPIDTTFLVYPEYNAMFWELRTVMSFTSDTEFRYSDFTIEEAFLAHLSSFETDQLDKYIKSVWLCPE